jgi:methyl-accepting chemotaxis protein
MNWFGNLKIAHKLALVFGLCLLLFFIVGAMAVARMAQMNRVSEEIVHNAFAGTSDLAKFDGPCRQYRIVQYRNVLSATDQDKDKAEADLKRFGGQAEVALDAYGKHADSPDDRRNFDQLKTDWDDYLSNTDQLLALSRQNKTRECAALINGPMLKQYFKLIDQIDLMSEWNERQAALYAKQADDSYHASCWVILLALALAIAIVWFACRMLTGFTMSNLTRFRERLNSLNMICVESLSHSVEAMAGGDLTVHVATGTQPLDIKSLDEFGAMAQDLNSIIQRLQATIAQYHKAQANMRQMIGHVAQSSEAVRETAQVLRTAAEQSCDAASQSSQAIQQVATAIQQVAKGATVQTEQITNAATSMQQLTASTTEIAKGAQEQAISIQESLQKLEEMNVAVQGMSQEAQTAAQVATQADETAKIGNEVVQKTVEGMQRIQMAVEASSTKIQELGKSSQQIGAIVAVIEEIAEQTNLLALNAAIEAARAGEQGRGFAVVADEVRKLAERSAGATKEISGLIDAVQQGTQEVVEAMSQGSSEVERGSQLAQQAGDALESIQSTVRQSRQQFEAIEEALGLIEANAKKVLSQMSNVAAVTEESASFAKQAGDGATQVEHLMEGIAAVSEENSAATEEVSASTEEVSAATEEMQAQVEEMAQSASRLSILAGDLQEMVSVFKTEQSPGAAAQLASEEDTSGLRLVA